MANVPEHQDDPMWPNREATKINVAFEKVGYSQAEITRWWNHSAYEALDGRTPTQAWNAGDFLRVKRLVEELVSEKFAAQLAQNPTILERLARAKER